MEFVNVKPIIFNTVPSGSDEMGKKKTPIRSEPGFRCFRGKKFTQLLKLTVPIFLLISLAI